MRKSMKKVVIALASVCALSSFAVGQRGQQPAVQAQPRASATKPTDDQTISVNVDLVNIPVSVADKKGKYVTSLKKEDFKVFEDSKLQSITNFSNESNLPLTIALLVDTSG